MSHTSKVQSSEEQKVESDLETTLEQLNLNDDNTDNNPRLKVVDLCAGSGAFSLALHQTDRFRTVYANDFEPKCKPVFDLNVPGVKLTVADITEVKNEDIPQMDIITAGFPCQPFSKAGRREGLQDPRARVFPRIVQLVKHHRPRFVLCENVSDLLTMNKGAVFKSLTTLFDTEVPGYHLKYARYNTSEHTGIPQNRERVYIIWFREQGDYERFTFPQKPVTKRTVSSFLEPEPSISDEYYYNDEKKCQDLNTILTQVKKNVYTNNTVYHYRQTYVRENKSFEVPTLTANMGTGGHNVPLIRDNKGVRKLTPRECFRFQGFPDTYKFPPKKEGRKKNGGGGDDTVTNSTLYKICGNAITFPIACMIAGELTKLI